MSTKTKTRPAPPSFPELRNIMTGRVNNFNTRPPTTVMETATGSTEFKPNYDLPLADFLESLDFPDLNVSRNLG